MIYYSNDTLNKRYCQFILYYSTDVSIQSAHQYNKLVTTAKPMHAPLFKM